MDISYEIIRSSRKTISLQILPDGRVQVRCPRRMAKRDIAAFVQSKDAWLQKHLTAIASRPAPEVLTEAQLAELTRQARERIPQRLSHYAPLIGVTYSRVTIRRQRTRWGSCSGNGNLNFNCLLMLCPPEVLDYVVVHELCHRKQMNHSPAFWAEVAAILPHCQSQKAWLRQHGPQLMQKLPR